MTIGRSNGQLQVGIDVGFLQQDNVPCQQIEVINEAECNCFLISAVCRLICIWDICQEQGF